MHLECWKDMDTSDIQLHWLSCSIRSCLKISYGWFSVGLPCVTCHIISIRLFCVNRLNRSILPKCFLVEVSQINLVMNMFI